MSLIDDDDVDVGTRASQQGLCTNDLNRLCWIGALMSTLQDADGANSLGLERRHGLVDEIQFGHNECDTFPFAASTVDDVRRNNSLAGAGRSLVQWASMAPPN